MRLNDRTAIVTGASMGIGAATAVALANRGVTVWAVARNRERLENVAGHHARIHPIVGDMSTDADRARLIDAVVGDVDILVNNAGIAYMGLVESTPAEEVRHLFELNVLGMIDLTQRVLPEMLRRRGGHICNVGSSVSYMSGPPLTIYAATKYAIEGFTEGLRREVLGRGVTVSLIQPGPVRTGFWDRAVSGDRPDVAEQSGAGVPAGWVANAIVRAVRFDRLPGYRRIGVPRPIGLGRLLDLPGVSLILDQAMRVVHAPQRGDAPVQGGEVIPISNPAANIPEEENHPPPTA